MSEQQPKRGQLWTVHNVPVWGENPNQIRAKWRNAYILQLDEVTATRSTVVILPTSSQAHRSQDPLAIKLGPPIVSECWLLCDQPFTVRWRSAPGWDSRLGDLVCEPMEWLTREVDRRVRYLLGF